MSRTTTPSVSSSRSLFENLEGRSLFSVVIGNVDFNNDGLITGDDYAAIDAEGADAGASERLGWALSVDYNQDGAISGDDYAALDGTNAEPMAYQRLDAVLEGMKQSEAAANAIFEGPDFNGDGKISGDDFGTLDSHSAPKADYDTLTEALSVDFNGDGKITGDDYAVLGAQGDAADSNDYTSLDNWLANHPTPTEAASADSFFNGLPGAGCDFNGDGLITGDDFATLGSIGASPDLYEKLSNALKVDFNGDGHITGDDYGTLDSNGGTVQQYNDLTDYLNTRF